MSNFKFTTGLNNVGSYQVSSMPYITASLNCATRVMKVVFPYVTRWIVVQNNSLQAWEDLKVGFSEFGVSGSNYFTIFNRQSATAADRSSICPRLELKLSEIYISGSSDVEIIAGLTNIPVQRVDNIAPSGSNWSGSIGVG